MSKVLIEEIKSIEQLAPAIYKMTVKSEYISKNSVPGQFVNIKCCEGINALLRRPISICNVDKAACTFDIIFQVKGVGTEYLAQKKAGSKIDIIGPLGRGFDIDDNYTNIAVIGGGIGIFPLLYVLKEKTGVQKTSFIGFRNKDYAVLTEEFGTYSDKFLVSTDDGSMGYKGLITDLLEEELTGGTYDMIYTCGPTPMIRKVVEIADKNKIKCQVSLEQRMGCGIGACLVCACKIKSKNEWEYKHVCKDGPVFWSDEVIFDD